MQRLSKIEVDALRHAVEQWQSPAELAQSVDHITSDVLFNQSGLQFVRDAMIGSTFASLRKASQVRVVADEWPDFELRVENRLDRFEATEALDPRRRRGPEYRFEDTTQAVNSVTYEKISADADLAPSWLADACRKKAEKAYSTKINLAVYFNFGEYGWRHKEILAQLETASAPAKDAFASVWIMWKERLYLTWQDGKAALTRNGSA